VGGGYKCFFPVFFLVGGQKIQKKSEPGLGVEYFFFNYPMVHVNKNGAEIPKKIYFAF
jgi:hypothetical protein